MKEPISYFSPPKALQRQKRYLRRGMHKSHDTKIQYFIYCINKMIKYLKTFPPFEVGQRLPEDDILELVELSLLNEWQKELIIQVFDSETQGLTDIFKFCERLETTEEIFQTQGEGNHQNKKTKQ